jgi:hypothetical protein
VRADLAVDGRAAAAFPEYVTTFVDTAMKALRDQQEQWAADMWISTDEDHRHLLRMMEAPTIDTFVDRGASLTYDDLRLVVECDPPTFWCELPAGHPALVS